MTRTVFESEATRLLSSVELRREYIGKAHKKDAAFLGETVTLDEVKISGIHLNHDMQTTLDGMQANPQIYAPEAARILVEKDINVRGVTQAMKLLFGRLDSFTSGCAVSHVPPIREADGTYSMIFSGKNLLQSMRDAKLNVENATGLGGKPTGVTTGSKDSAMLIPRVTVGLAV